MGPGPRGIDFDPFPPCTLNQLSNCQLFEYPRVSGQSQASTGLGIDGFPAGPNTQRVCDHFHPTVTGSITSVCWWGTYGAPPAGGACGDMPTNPDVDNFVITYYGRTPQGLPDTGNIIGGPFVQDSGELTVSRTGLCDSGGLTSAAFSATHAPVSVSAGTCYFIEIRNITDGVQTWFWSRTSPPIDGACFVDTTSDGYSLTELTNGDRAFCVGINIDPFGQGSAVCLPPANPPPENDECDTAMPISGVGNTAFDNSSATTGVEGQTNAACSYAGGAIGIERDIWFDWTAGAPGFSDGDLIRATVGTCGSSLILDSKMAVYHRPEGGGCPAESDLIDCIDDVCDQTPVNNANVAARVTFDATVGQHYIFQVGGATVGQAGIQTLFVTATASVGQCCLPGGDCAVVTSTRCAALGGSYAGDGTTCGGAYASAPGTNAIEDIGGTGASLSFTQGDDDYATVALPFPFRFFGEEHDSINVGVNGQIGFGGPLYTYANTWTIPTHPVEPNAYAAVLADDLIVAPAATGTGCSDGRILVETRGTAPNRRTIVQWDDVCHFSFGGGMADDDNTFQAILYENGNIEFRYASVGAPEITPTGGAAPGYIIGIESESGAGSVAVDDGTNPPQAPGSSVLFTYTANPSGDCPSGPACPCDFNTDNVLNSQDFFDFLNCFFTTGCAAGDYNHDMTVNSQDFFDFLNCFFMPPAGCD
jgi:hypothetical protein